MQIIKKNYWVDPEKRIKDRWTHRDEQERTGQIL